MRIVNATVVSFRNPNPPVLADGIPYAVSHASHLKKGWEAWEK